MSATAAAFAETDHDILADKSTRPRSQAGPPMTLGNIRANGVRSLAVSCWKCHHRTIMSADVTVERLGTVVRNVGATAGRRDEARVTDEWPRIASTGLLRRRAACSVTVLVVRGLIERDAEGPLVLRKEGRAVLDVLARLANLGSVSSPNGAACFSQKSGALGEHCKQRSRRPMKRPSPTDFEITVHDGGAEATFKPTDSHYSYTFHADPEDSAQFGPLSLDPHIRHGGPSGDTGEYPEFEVRQMAYELARKRVATR
jgi:hypothetical protein